MNVSMFNHKMFLKYFSSFTKESFICNPLFRNCERISCTIYRNCVNISNRKSSIFEISMKWWKSTWSYFRNESVDVNWKRYDMKWKKCVKNIWNERNIRFYSNCLFKLVNFNIVKNMAMNVVNVVKIYAHGSTLGNPGAPALSIYIKKICYS